MADDFAFKPLMALYSIADQVSRRNLPPEALTLPLQEIDRLFAFRDSTLGQRILQYVKDTYTGDPCDIDVDDATLMYHNGEDGYWVMGWLWVSAEEVADGGSEAQAESV